MSPYENQSITIATLTILSYETSGVNGYSITDFQMVLVRGTDQDKINYVSNNQRNNPYSNTYKAEWRNHPNFSYKINLFSL